ncbi:MAG: DNA repair protein RecN [Cyanobacteria bacterium SID2]|nr:DNA repair protein RecN [Cyanobacteria bacterium SID2]MBP0006254.1 DNA repair protein RecN [Cyanobacteria bacterium SBC]
MLLHLQIENFALIDALDLEFSAGLNVLTGETGAGKSIVLDALDAVLGGKANRRSIRTGATRTRIEAVFQLAADEIVACSRELIANGRSCRSKYRLNGTPVSQKHVRQLRERLVEIAAQGQAVQLGQNAHQRELLDLYGGTILLEVRQTVATAFDRLQRAEAILAERQALNRQRSQQLDLWTFQLEELQNAHLEDPDELDELEREAQRLNHVVELQQQSYQSYRALYENEDNAAASDLLGASETVLANMAEYDVRVEPILTLVREALVRIEEAGQQLNTYADHLEADPERLAYVSERIRQLKQVCRKYGPTLAEAIDRYRDLQQQLDALDGEEGSIEDLERRCQTRRADLQAGCDRLTQLRRDAARQLESRLVEALKPLAMEKVKFQVDLASTSPTRTGGDRVTFLLSANPGEPLQPLSETASGGEMSRFLLALKACFSDVDTVSTFVFDEIDVGVSGRVASTIAETLYRLSQHHQVLCVTHQPLVAAMADCHFHVAKQAIEASSDERTVVRVHRLDPAERREELAQLAIGQTDRDTAPADARAAATAFADVLLDRAERLRQQLQPKPDKAIVSRSRR